MRFGLQLWSQQTTWPDFRDAALAAGSAGWDSVWTWDHLFAIFGPWEQPIFEGWSVLAGLAPLTSKLRLGLMVGANTFRNLGEHCADVGRDIAVIEKTVIVRMPAPYDRETIDRMVQVSELLGT